MASHQPRPMRKVTTPHRIVETLERPLARPGSPRPSPAATSSSPGAGAGDGVAAEAVWPGASVATTMRRSLAEYFGWQVVSVRVGVGVGSSTSTWLGFTTWIRATVYR